MGKTAGTVSTPDPLPLKAPCGFTPLYFPAHKGTLSSTLPLAPWPTITCPEMPRKSMPLHKQAPGLPLPCRHLKVHWLLPHRHYEITTQHWEPATTCASGSQAPHFANLLVPGGLPSHSAQKPSTPPQCLPMGESLSPIRAGTPDPPLSGSLLLCGQYQKDCFPMVHRGPALLTIPTTPAPPLKSCNTTSTTEGRKAITCYSEDGTMRPASPQCTEAQHSPITPACRRPLALSSKGRNPSFSTEGGKW
jgi:hypothetical protein